MNDLETLAAAVAKAAAAADRLLKCAESISNPVYSITMGGQALDILAVHHFQGQINIQVKSPLNDIPQRNRLGLTQDELMLGAIDVQR